MNRVERYNSLDGLRAYSAICILAMHVFANSEYVIPILNVLELMPFLNNLTFLFMMLSAFSMCCGYYERMRNGTISLSAFYRKRYQKVWPFFALLVLLDLAMSPSRATLYEAFADLTLSFGLLPNANISVIGVGWFLGVIFEFYMLFPFFCFLLENGKRAWFSFAVAILLNISCTTYFFDINHVAFGFYSRTSFIYCFIFFMAGGLLYLYRKKLASATARYRWFILALCLLGTIVYLLVPSLRNIVIMPIVLAVLYSFYIIYAIGINGRVLNNTFTRFIAGISMEIYLCHMLVFRVVEKMRLNYLFGAGCLSYIITIVFVSGGAVAFSMCVKEIFYMCSRRKNCI